MLGSQFRNLFWVFGGWEANRKNIQKGKQNAIGDADFYTITFPPEANPEDKVMLIGATIMVDYLYYEDKDDSESQNRHHHNRGPHHHH